MADKPSAPLPERPATADAAAGSKPDSGKETPSRNRRVRELVYFFHRAGS